MSRRSEIALFSLNFPPEPTGIAPYSGGLADSLSKAGYHVTAHVAQPHYPEWSLRKGSRQWSRSEIINSVEVCRRLHYVPKSPRGSRRVLSEISFGIRLVFARWRSPDLIIAVSPSLFSSGMVALRSKLARRSPRLIIWVQDLYSLGIEETGEGGRTVQRAVGWVEGAMLRAADQVVVIHERFAAYIVENFCVDASKVTVIRNWTHLDSRGPIQSASARRLLNWPNDSTLIVHTGNLGSKQGLENVVEAARLADKVGLKLHFILVGDGSEREALQALARGVSRLSFVDPLGEYEYRLALNAADVLLVNEKPGVSAMAVPSKLTSYMDAAKPILAATDPDGITASEIRAANAGVVVRAGDPQTLLSAAISLAGDPEACARYGANGKVFRNSFLGRDTAIARWRTVLERSWIDQNGV